MVQRIKIFAPLVFISVCGACPLKAATNTPASSATPALAPLPPLGSQSAAPAATPSPNQALAEMAKDAVMKSIKPEYDKEDNWGHQKEIVDGYHWEQRADGWHFVKQKKKVNDGIWRRYTVKIDNPEKNLKLRFTPPEPAPNGGTAFQAFLTARLWADGVQEHWVLGVKGLNFHVEGFATIRARLDIVVNTKPVEGASFGTIEVLPQVTDVNLELVDLTLTKVDMLHGDAARELGRMMKDIVAGEMKKREPEMVTKINAQILKNRQKLQFSPTQIAEVGWQKVQSLLSSFTGGSDSSSDKKPAQTSSIPTSSTQTSSTQPSPTQN
jgi:hypothetical protein